jgi:hypothetical protein
MAVDSYEEITSWPLGLINLSIDIITGIPLNLNFGTFYRIGITPSFLDLLPYDHNNISLGKRVTRAGRVLIASARASNRYQKDEKYS